MNNERGTQKLIEGVLDDGGKIWLLHFHSPLL